jgi:hypothetical protein
MEYNPAKYIRKFIDSEFLLFLLSINNKKLKLEFPIKNESDLRRFNILKENLDKLNETF